MNETAIEVILLAINAIGAGVLLFVSSVAQKLMNDMEPIEFKKFLNKLDVAAMSDPLAVSIGTIPIIAVIFYLVAFGFDHWWFVAGIVLWMVGTSITKVTNLPVYVWVADPKNTDTEELKKQRRKLAGGNQWRAWLTLASVAAMACQFSVMWTVATVVALAAIAYPALWLSQKYTPNGVKH